MKLTDLLSVEKWTDLEKKIHARSGLDCNVFNPEGIRITQFKNWVNRLCPAIKASDKGQSFICAVAHMNIAAQAMHTKSPVVEECDAGLVKLVVPIFFKEEFLGAVGACGLLLTEGEVDTFMINKTIDLSEAEIEKLSDDISVVTSSALNSLTNYIQNEINRIIKEADS